MWIEGTAGVSAMDVDYYGWGLPVNHAFNDGLNLGVHNSILFFRMVLASVR